MVAANVISIEVTTTDKAGLAQLARDAKKVGKEIEDGLGKGIDAAERKAREGGDKITKPLKESASKIDKSFDQAARQVGRYMYQIEREAWASGDGIDGAFSEASRSIRAELDGIRKTAAKTGDGLETDLGDALKKVQQQASQLHSTISKGVSDGAEDSGGGLLDELLGDIPKGAAAGVAAGTAIAGFIWKGLQSEWQEDAVGGLITAQTGAAYSAAEGLGDIAGDVFADNFGTSIEQVGEAMSAVFENKLIKTDAPAAAIQDITERVMTLSQVTGESFDAIAYSAHQMVNTGIAGSVTEAMDLIGSAAEHGLNASNDLLDGIDEYSTKFRDLGLNGQEALGLVSQAMAGGARDTDSAMDALKEFAIRAQDMSVTTRRGFQTIGLDADQMGKDIAAGGASANAALGKTLDALHQMPPGVERSTAAVDLFGTKAEDLGNALYDMDLGSAASEFEDFGGTVDEMAKKLGDSTSFWDKVGRGIAEATNNLGEFLDMDTAEALEGMPEVKEALEDINKAASEFDATGNTEALDALKQKYPEAAEQIDAYIEKKREEQSATDESTGSNEEYVRSLQQIIDANTELAGGVLDLSDAQIGYNQDLADGTEAMQKFAGQGLTAAKDGFDLTTEAGQEMNGTLNDVARGALDVMDAMQQQGATTQEVQGFVQTAREQFVNMATGMGLSADAANDLANKLGLVPGKYEASVAVSGYEAAYAKVQNMINILAQMPTYKQITLNTIRTGVGPIVGGHANVGQASGGAVGAGWGAATGGSRHSTTMINEAGPEVVELPTGSRVMTAGATRAMGEAGLLGGGGGGVQVVLSMEGGDELTRALMKAIRVTVKNEHGGSVTQAFNKRGVA